MTLSFRISNVIFASLALLMLLFTMFSSAVHANSLDGIGTEEKSVPTQEVTAPDPTVIKEPASGNGADTLGNLFDEVGVDQEAAQQANRYVAPVAKTVNVTFAIILGFASLGMFLTTGLDLLFIAIPPVRRFLYPTGQGHNGMMLGSGIGGIGGVERMNQSAMNETMGQQQSSPFVSRWISDEAVAAVGSLSSANIMGMQQAEPPRTKHELLEYLKKRALFLLMFGICAVLLSTTIFTDIGVKIGTWVINRLLGFEASIPE